MEHAVEQVVTVMRDRYHERLYVPELAAETFFSPFHFTRIFRRDTGVTPCQYLTAVRLFEAKRLLLNTSLSVADVACRVGYPGVGTFTTRFTRLVGVSPGLYRRLPKAGMLSIADDVKRLPNVDVLNAARPRPVPNGASIVGSVKFDGSITRLLVGAFDEPIPQAPPALWDCTEDAARCWRLDGLPSGEWTIIAVAESATEPTILVGSHTAIRVSAGMSARIDIELHRPRRTDAPIMVPIRAHTPFVDQLAA
jgi:AraC family transcriptional regulator